MTADAEWPAVSAAWSGERSAAVRSILGLAAPLTAFFAIQSATSLASVGMIGRLGNGALAGVGAAGAVYGVVLALMFGADAAVQATVSRRVGAGRTERLGQVLADALALVLPLGLSLAVGLGVFAPNVMHAMLPDGGAALAGVAYLRAAAPSLVGLAVTIPVNACWIGSGRPHLPLLVTAVLAPVQIAATFAFVFGWGSWAGAGVAGAGAGISFTSLIGVALQLTLATRRGAIAGFPQTLPRAAGAGDIAAIGWPISLQQAFLQLGLIVAYLIVARLGVAQVAAANVLITLATVPAQLAVGLGVAAATLVGQSLGRGDIAEARRWGWRTAAASVAFSVPFALIAVAATRPLLGLFLRDPATLAIAVWPTRIVGLGLAADMLGRVLCFAIRGAGATRTGAAIPFVFQWLVQIPLVWWLALGLGFGLLGMAGVQAGAGVVEALVTALVWTGSSWTVHRILSRTSRRALRRARVT
jgi:MATE family multidrug resistance protein